MSRSFIGQFLVSMLAAGVLVACDDGDSSDGDVVCGEGTVRSGDDCVAVDGGVGGGAGGGAAGGDTGGGAGGGAGGGTGGSTGGAGGGTGGDTGGGEGGGTGGDTGGGEGGGAGGDTGGGAGGGVGGDTGGGAGGGGGEGGEGGMAAPELPIVVDEAFAASGYMGVGENEGGILDEADCPMRGADGAVGNCHHFTFAGGDPGWGGVWWQSPEGNWGDDPGFPMPEGATRIHFVAWGAAGGEQVNFVAGYGSDGFSVETGTVTLAAEPTTYTLEIAGVPYTDIAGGFGWVTEGADPIEFYVDDIQYVGDPNDEVDPCNVSCATLPRAAMNCGELPAYGYCRTACGEQRGGACGAEADAWLACVGTDGFECANDAYTPANDCAAAAAALEACEIAAVGEFETVTFDDEGVQYAIRGFGGAEGMVVVDPTDDENTVGEVLKTDAAELWAGVTFSTAPGETVGVIPFDAENTQMTVRVWSPDAGIQVRLKAENADNEEIAAETEATTSMAGAWEVLTFDFANPAAGTAALNPEATYDRLSIFMGFGVTGEDNGEAKTYYFDDVTFIGGGGIGPPPDTFDVDFRVDMTCSGLEDFETVYITGPFCDWCDQGFPLADEDGDGVWEGTYAFPAGPLEFKYMVDMYADQEDLVDDVAAGGMCAPVNGGDFANRQIVVAEGAATDDTYGSCFGCDGGPMNNLDPFQTVTFDDDMIEYAIRGFDGAEDESAIVEDPTDAENTVGRVTKGEAAEPWAGVTFASGPNETVGRIPFSDGNTRLTVRVWSPDADITVRVKAEDSLDPTRSVETEATTTVAGDWEVLTFDFANQAPDTAAINFEFVYDRLSIFFGFGTTGADQGGVKTYYFDDVTFDGEIAPPMDITVDFRVDMSCSGPDEFGTVFVTGPFCEWCADGFPLADEDGDGVWEGSYDFPAGPLEYKYMVDGFAVQEDLIGDGACAPVTDGVEFANRERMVAPGATFDDTWGQCEACEDVDPPGGDAILDWTFDEAASIEGWMPVANADSDEASLGWNDGGGNPGGALQITGANSDGMGGRAFIFQATANGLDFTGAGSVTVSFDLRLAAPLVGSALHVTTTLPGVGAVETLDLQNRGLNQDGWTTIELDFDDVDVNGDTFTIAFNFAAGADMGAGGDVLVDNIRIDAAAAPMVVPVTFSVDMNCGGPDDFGTVFVTGPFCEWCADGFPLADEDGDGVWEGTFDFMPGALEYKYMVDGFASQEDLLDDVQAGGMCAPINGGDFANRQVVIEPGVVIADTYGQCAACDDMGGGGDAILDWTFDEAASIEGWMPVANADSDEASLGWNDGGGNPGGALQITGANSDGMGGRAFIFQASANGLDFTGAGSVTVRFDLRLAAPLIGSAFHVTTTLPGVGAVETLDLQNRGLNEGAWTTIELPFDGVDVNGDTFTIAFNFAAGADMGAGGDVLVDNIRITAGGGQMGGGDDPFEAITFDAGTTNYSFGDFGGAVGVRVVDPTDAGNMVAQITKGGMAELWAGVTIATNEANFSVPRLPLDADNTQMSVRVWSPDANIQVMLKVEDATNPQVSVETLATIQNAAAWETLTFDFANEREGTAAFNAAASYDKVSIFFNYGVTGVEAGGERIYYCDDIAMAP
jgi:hypothetical protein